MGMMRAGLCGVGSAAAAAAGWPWRAREANLDDRGELTGKVSEKWIPNQASHGFLASSENLRGRQGLCRWSECEKVGEPGTQG